MLALPLLLAAALGVLLLDNMVRDRFSGAKWALPTHVYSRPLELYAGRPLPRAALLEELDELGYRRVDRAARPGQFAVAGNAVELYARAFHFPEGEQPEQRVRLRLSATGIAGLSAAGGQPLPLLRLEPIRIGGIYPEHAEDRILLRLEELPPYLADAVIAVEDRDFHRHHGVSPRAILRALWANVRAGGIAQGGSTITQQLVKNFYLDRSRTLARKVMEAVMAILLELHYSKAEILEAYLNEIHLGQEGNRAIHGFGMASEFYFRQPLAELDLHQVALLVGMAKGSSHYNPRRHPERALARRNLVLDTLAREQIVPAAQASEAQRQPLGVTRAAGAVNRYPDYLDLVRRDLQRDYAARDLTAEGLRVFTHFDPRIQRRVEQGIAHVLGRIEAERKLAPGTLQAAAVVVLLLGGIGVVLSAIQNTGRDAGSTATETSAGGGVEAAPKTTEGGYPVTASGRNWSAETVVDAVPEIVAGTVGPPAESPAADQGGGSDSTPDTKDSARVLSSAGRLASGEELARCVGNLNLGPVTPLAVDLARWEGNPAAVIVLPTPDDPSTADLFVVTPACPAGEFLYFARVPRP